MCVCDASVCLDHVLCAQTDVRSKEQQQQQKAEGWKKGYIQKYTNSCEEDLSDGRYDGFFHLYNNDNNNIFNKKEREGEIYI